MGDSRAWWDRAAQRDPEWHVATRAAGHPLFFGLGAAETDSLLAFCGIAPQPDFTVVEIGCGIGRMTRRLSEVYGEVIAVDVSPVMLERAQRNLADRENVSFVAGSGSDLVQVRSSSVDAVFSYITLQHVPSEEGVLSYVRETLRVLRAGGRAGVQVRRPGWRAGVMDAASHVWHALQGRGTLAREWRGSRVPLARIVEAVHGGGGKVEFRPRGSRHVWVIIDKV